MASDAGAAEKYSQELQKEGMDKKDADQRADKVIAAAKPR